MIELPTDENPVVVFHGDCLDILPQIPAGVVDAVVTDPPYGIGEAAGKNKSRGLLARSKDYGNETWDNKTADEAIEMAVALADYSIVFGGNYYSLPPTSCWLIWDKMNGKTDFADCELAWTNLPKAVRRIYHRWHGMIRQDNEERFHPTQKPLRVMRWAICHLPPTANIILDPFAGSGTTGVAAILEGRKAILIEKDAGYVEVIKKRIAETLGRRTTLANGKVVGVNLFENIL